MPKRLKIDRAIYLVDDKTKTYRLLSRNPEWENLRPQENERNKRLIDGYTRVFKVGRRKTFRYRATT